MTIPPASDAAADSKPILLPPPTPLDGFSIDEFKARRAALRKAIPDGIIIIRGSTEDEVPPWTAVRYRQNATFFYLTGVDAPAAYLVLLPDDVPASVGLRGVKNDAREIMFLPARDAAAEVWSGPKLGPGEETQTLTGIQHAAEAAKFLPAVANWIRRCSAVHTMTPFGESAKGTKYWALMQQIADRAPAVQFHDLSRQMAVLRAVKSPAEVDRLRQAIAVTQAGHRAARAVIANGAGRREYDVEAAVLQAYRSAGSGPSFAAIVGAGVNAAILHYEHNDAELKTGDLVVVDIGAKVGHYCGDITRTYPVGGKFEGSRRREVYELVLAAHQHAVSEFKPGGDSLDSMNDRCKAFLKSSGSRAKDAGKTDKTMDVFMPHSLGHHLGLDVHDVNDAADRHTPLPMGSVITIEPGIYLPDESIGVRIEDDYLVTPTGLENLGAGLEVEIDQLEKSMRR